MNASHAVPMLSMNLKSFAFTERVVAGLLARDGDGVADKPTNCPEGFNTTATGDLRPARRGKKRTPRFALLS
jgi:hypothetical protein